MAGPNGKVSWLLPTPLLEYMVLKGSWRQTSNDSPSEAWKLWEHPVSNIYPRLGIRMSCSPMSRLMMSMLPSPDGASALIEHTNLSSIRPNHPMTYSRLMRNDTLSEAWKPWEHPGSNLYLRLAIRVSCSQMSRLMISRLPSPDDASALIDHTQLI